MENYMVSLERFYGPLDLLLYLVERDELNIYDVSISDITDQYLAYIRQAEAVDVEKMTAFLQMATFLLQLKSRTLLPKAPVFTEDGTDEPDPQAELIGRIMLYKQFKTVAHLLDERQQAVVERAFYRPESSLPPAPPPRFAGEKESLKQALEHIRKRRELYRTFTLPFADIRIEDKMQELWEQLQDKRMLRFSEAAGSHNRRELTAAFLALLELMRQQKIRVRQAGLFEEIVIQAA